MRQGGALSRNPNMCASCSSLADGMQELDSTDRATPVLFRKPVLEKAGDDHELGLQPQGVEPAAHDITRGYS